MLGLAITSSTGLLALGKAASKKETWVWGWQPGSQLPEECCPWKELASRLSLLPASQLLSPAPLPTQPGPCLEGPSAPGPPGLGVPAGTLAGSLTHACTQPASYLLGNYCTTSSALAMASLVLDPVLCGPVS